jgi:hypothetical protein
MEWQLIETAPKDGTVVDLWIMGPRNSGSRAADCWFEGEKWLQEFGREGPCEVGEMIGDVPTHWMRRPLPPSI